jgi:hypothetical protein
VAGVHRALLPGVRVQFDRRRPVLQVRSQQIKLPESVRSGGCSAEENILAGDQMIFSNRYRCRGHDPAECDRDRALLAAIRVAPLASLIRALRVWRGDRDWRRVAVLRQIRRLGP